MTYIKENNTIIIVKNINGQQFKYIKSYQNKNLASIKAKKLRQKGFYVRIIKESETNYDHMTWLKLNTKIWYVLYTKQK